MDNQMTVLEYIAVQTKQWHVLFN